MKHIVLISHNGENSWESFSTKEDALRYMDYLKINITMTSLLFTL